MERRFDRILRFLYGIAVGLCRVIAGNWKMDFTAIAVTEWGVCSIIRSSINIFSNNYVNYEQIRLYQVLSARHCDERRQGGGLGS